MQMQPGKKLSFAAAFLTAACSLAASAADMTRIPSGSSTLIDVHGTCRVVSNQNANPVMVPHSKSSEWNIGPKAFLAEPRPGLGVDFCGRIDPGITWRKVLDICSDVYQVLKYGNYGNCGGAYSEGQITKDGRYVFVFLNAYSGSYGIPRLFIYDMNNGNPVRVETVMGKSYPRPTSAFAMNNTGNRFVLWNRRYTNDSSYSPELELYSFNGSTATKLATVAESGLGGYSSPAISNDGQWIYFSDDLYRWTGSALVKVPTYNQNLSPYAISGAQVIWSESLSGFFISHASGVLFMSQDAAGRWIQKPAITYPAAQYTYNISVSDDGNRIVSIINAAGTEVIPHAHVYERSSGIWRDVAQFDLPAKIRTFMSNYGALSSGVGKFLLYPYDPVIRQYDLSKASAGVVTRVADLTLSPQTLDDGEGGLVYTRITDVKSGYMMINNTSGRNNGTYNGIFELFYTTP